MRGWGPCRRVRDEASGTIPRMPRKRRRRRKRRPRWLQLPTGNAGRLWWAIAALLLAAAAWLAYDQVRQATAIPPDLDPLITARAQEAELPPELIRAVVITESGGDPRALSSASARGLMQITPITHREVIRRFKLDEADDEKLYDPEYNLMVGTRYLAYLLDRFEGDLKLALAAYHMGPTAVARLQRQHPGLTTDQLLALDGENQVGPKTRAYVANVLRRAGMEDD